MVLYSYENISFIDFNTLNRLYEFSRSDLYRYLHRSKIQKIKFNNRYLYNFDNILSDSFLSQYINPEIIN